MNSMSVAQLLWRFVIVPRSFKWLGLCCGTCFDGVEGSLKWRFIYSNIWMSIYLSCLYWGVKWIVPRFLPPVIRGDLQEEFFHSYGGNIWVVENLFLRREVNTISVYVWSIVLKVSSPVPIIELSLLYFLAINN